MDKTIIYLVRHGQTEWNLQHKMQGHQDSPLTPLGVLQAESLGRSLQDVHIDAVITSTSQRAKKTAEIAVKGRDIPCMESHLFKEICLGVWEGRSQLEIEEEYPLEYHLFWNDPERFSIQGSETFHDVAKRGLKGVDYILSKFRGQTILVLSHTVLIKVLLASFEDRPLQDLWGPPSIQPASLSRVEMVNHTPTIALYGDTSHL